MPNLMERFYVDTETLGLAGKVKLIQYSKPGNKKIIMFQPNETKKLEEFKKFMYDKNYTFVGYNIAFDLGKLYQIFGTEKKFKCKVVDLQLHAQLKHELGKYSFTRKGDRAIAKLTALPKVFADQLAEELAQKLRKQLPSTIEVKPHIHETDNKDLCDITFTIEGRMKLKSIMKYHGYKVQTIEDVWPLPKEGEENQHNPFEQECHRVIEPICDQILMDKKSKFWKYAENDIKYLHILDEILSYPETDHNDTMAHIDAFTYIYGFALDRDILKKMCAQYEEQINEANNLPFDINSPKQKKEYFQKKHPTLILKNCDKYVLQRLAKRGDTEAQMLQNIGSISNELDQAKKILSADDLKGHPRLKIIGTPTQRMSGSGGLNWQGIAKKSPLRKAILTSGGGDFSGLEIGLMATIYDDKKMQEELRSGKDIHLATAVNIHNSLKGVFTYEDARKIKLEFDGVDDSLKSPEYKIINTARSQTKSIVFGSAYGASAHAIAELTGMPIEEAELLLEAFYENYKDIKEYKLRLENEFCTGDIENWTRDSIAKMKRSIIDPLGYERSYEFEAMVATFFWETANSKMNDFQDMLAGLKNYTFIRRKEKGEQKPLQTIRSAMLGAALTIQKSIARSATNSIVQSTGAQLTKKTMAAIWDSFEEIGIAMLNVHDEIIIAKGFEKEMPKIQQVIHDYINSWHYKFPFLSMEMNQFERWSAR